MIERQILKVVYSPFKAFEDIIKNPTVKGPLLILVLGIVASAITGYVSLSKVNVQLETGPYVPFVTTNFFGGRMLLVLIDEAISLSFSWFILAGITILIVKAFRVSEGSWRILFFVIGYTLITSVVGTLIVALVLLPLPNVQLAWGVWNPTTSEMEETARQEIVKAYQVWFSSPTYQSLFYIQYILQGWAAALAAIALHALLGVSWSKAVAISTIATVLAFLTRLLLF